MGVINQQEYKEYLKSEHWMALRNSVITQTDGRCSVCLKQDALNDVHHIYYCGCWYKTKPHHLTCLCRECHQLVHGQLEGDESVKPAEHYKAFFKIRESLRAQNPTAVALAREHPEFVKRAERRPQHESMVATIDKREAKKEYKRLVSHQLSRLSADELNIVAVMIASKT